MGNHKKGKEPGENIAGKSRPSFTSDSLPPCGVLFETIFKGKLSEFKVLLFYPLSLKVEELFLKYKPNPANGKKPSLNGSG